MTDGRRNDGDDLERRIAAARTAFDPARGETHPAAGESKGWAAGIEFVGSVIVGAFIGWALDTWLGTKPWLLIVFLVLGFGAGLRRAMQASKLIDTHAAKTVAPTEKDTH